MSDVPLPSGRFDACLGICKGRELLPFLRRYDEGRALAAVGPELSVLVRHWPWPMSHQFGSKGSGPGQFNSPSNIAFSSDGYIVVCDTNNHRIQIFQPDGTFVRKWGSFGIAQGQFNYPSSVAVSSNDDVFVLGLDCVEVFRLDGSFVCSWGSSGTGPGQFQSCNGVAIHNDMVLISDTGNHRIQCFGLDGTFMRMWGTKGTAPGQFILPCGIAVSSIGEVFVCDIGNKRMQVFDLDGTFQRTWGSNGIAPNEINYIFCVAVSSVGEVLVSDRMHVQVFLADGTFVRSLHLPDDTRTKFDEHIYVNVMPSRDVVICDGKNNCIYVKLAGA